jgi:bacterioferritin
MAAYPGDSARQQHHPFLSSVAEIRRLARQQIEQGGANASHATEREAVLRLLNAALATELVCVLRYRRYSAMNTAAVADAVRSEFVKRAQEEQSHADQIAARIIELGGEPQFEPPGAANHGDGEYDEDEMLADMLAEDLIAERIAIDTYREIIGSLGEHDSTTRRLIEGIVSAEQGHAAELASLRDDIRRQERTAAAADYSSGVSEKMR